MALGDVLGQSQLLDAGRSWLIRVAVVEAAWATVLALPVSWLYGRAARGSKGVGTRRRRPDSRSVRGDRLADQMTDQADDAPSRRRRRSA